MIPVRRLASRADNRDRVMVKKFCISFEIEERRGIVDFPQALGILGFIPSQQYTSCRLSLGQLVGRIAQRARRE